MTWLLQNRESRKQRTSTKTKMVVGAQPRQAAHVRTQCPFACDCCMRTQTFFRVALQHARHRSDTLLKVAGENVFLLICSSLRILACKSAHPHHAPRRHVNFLGGVGQLLLVKLSNGPPLVSRRHVCVRICELYMHLSKPELRMQTL